MRLKRQAFTFAEILAALTFLGILVPVLVSALLASNRAGVISERSTLAVQLGENELNELMLANAWSTAKPSGDFGADWPGYRWELAQKDWQSGSMTELTLSVFYPVQGKEDSVRLSTLVNTLLTPS